MRQEQAADLKIGQQQEFVAGWDERVRPAGQPRIVARSATILSAPEAERRYGVDKRQVSRWRTLTAPDRVDDYRQRIIDAAAIEAGFRPTWAGSAAAKHLAAIVNRSVITAAALKQNHDDAEAVMRQYQKPAAAPPKALSHDEQAVRFLREKLEAGPCPAEALDAAVGSRAVARPKR